MRRLLVLAVAGLLTAALTACEGQDDSPPADSPFVVTTAQGELRGFAREGALVWRGIPYAAPPVGDLRWRPPAAPEPWEGTRSATAYGPACPQRSGETLSERLSGPIVNTREDCLYLNVTRPASGADLPVLVWLHGGGFTAGTGNLPVYNSTAFAERGVLLVTLNYRLGRLGFFAHPALSEEQPGEQIANYGLLDQVAALEWVRDNIAAFGGDPDAVTIVGESAGGMSVNALMSSPSASGLFAGAVSQSGLGREPSVSYARAERQGVAATGLLGLRDATADELRELPARALARLPLDLLRGAAPILDDVLPMSVADTFAAGEEAAVPYVVGSNDLELPDAFFEAGGRDPDEIRDRILGAGKEEAVAAYGGEDELDAHLMSDVVFTEPARHLALLHDEQAPAYLYRFEIVAPELREQLGGAPHAFEIPYVFGTADGFPEQAELIGDAWAAFASAGDPGWPRVGDGTLVRFTNDGWVETDDDPWAERLDAVEAGYEGGS